MVGFWQQMWQRRNMWMWIQILKSYVEERNRFLHLGNPRQTWEGEREDYVRPSLMLNAQNFVLSQLNHLTTFDVKPVLVVSIHFVYAWMLNTTLKVYILPAFNMFLSIDGTKSMLEVAALFHKFNKNHFMCNFIHCIKKWLSKLTTKRRFRLKRMNFINFTAQDIVDFEMGKLLTVWLGITHAPNYFLLEYADLK